MLRFDERVHLPKNRENTITFLVNGEPIGTVETLAPGAKTVDIPVPSVDYDSVTDALGYVPYDSSNPNGYITSSALANYVTLNTNQTITAVKSFHNAELLTDNFITLNGTTAYLRGQSGINYYNLINLNSSGITVGSANQPIKIAGSATRPQYNSNDLALYSDIPTVTEEVFVAEYGTTTFQEVLDAYNAGKAIYAKRQVTSNTYEIFSLCVKQATTFWFSNAGGVDSQHAFILPQNTVYTLDAQDNWDIGTFTCASNTLSNVSSIDSNSAVQTALDTKVDKSGDTMTGLLVLSNTDASWNSETLNIKSSNITRGTVPVSENQYEYIKFVDSNNDTLAQYYYRIDTNGERRAHVTCWNKDGSKQSVIMTGFDSNDNAMCTFPNTKRVDGQWVSSYSEMASRVSMGADTTKNYSLSSYLPNDGANYEVMFSIQGETGTSSGNGFEYRAYSDILSNVNGGGVIACRTRSNSSVYATSKFIMPVGSGRKIYIYNSNTQAGSTLVYLRAQGYRRIGTNS